MHDVATQFRQWRTPVLGCLLECLPAQATQGSTSPNLDPIRGPRGLPTFSAIVLGLAPTTMAACYLPALLPGKPNRGWPTRMGGWASRGDSTRGRLPRWVASKLQRGGGWARVGGMQWRARHR